MLGEVEIDTKQIETDYADVVQELVDRLVNDDVRVKQAIADSFVAWKTGPYIERQKSYYIIIKAKTDAVRDLLTSKKGKDLL